MMKRTTLLLIAACVAALPMNAAFASLINVDFNGDTTGTHGNSTTTTYAGTAAIGSSGDVWNGANGGSGTVSLLNSAGIASGATMTFAGSNYWCCGTGCSFGSSTYANLMNDYLIPSPGSTFATINGLATGTYNLYIYVASDKTDREATYTATVGGSTTSVTIGPNTNYVADFESGVTYGILEFTVASGDTLTLSATKVSGGEIDVDGFQLISVPEPASLALLISGSLAVAGYSCRRSNRQNKQKEVAT